MTADNNPPAVPAAPPVARKFTEHETVALVWLLEPGDVALVLAGRRHLERGEAESIARGVAHLEKRLPELEKGGALQDDEAKFTKRQLGKWQLLDERRKKDIDAAVRKRLGGLAVNTPYADFLRACEIAVQAPAQEPRRRSPPSESEKRMAEKDAAGLLCTNKACRSPRYRVIKIYPPKKGEDFKRRRVECLACGVRRNTKTVNEE